MRRRAVLRLRVVPVFLRRAVVRPPFAAALRDGALRVVLRFRVVVLRLRVPVERARVVAFRRVVLFFRVVLFLRVPVELERRRVPPVEREREVVLRLRVDDAFFRVPDLRDRLVVERLRPRLDEAATRETASSGCSGCSSGCCIRIGVSS